MARRGWNDRVHSRASHCNFYCCLAFAVDLLVDHRDGNLASRWMACEPDDSSRTLPQAGGHHSANGRSVGSRCAHRVLIVHFKRPGSPDGRGKFHLVGSYDTASCAAMRDIGHCPPGPFQFNWGNQEGGMAYACLGERRGRLRRPVSHGLLASTDGVRWGLGTTTSGATRLSQASASWSPWTPKRSTRTCWCWGMTEPKSPAMTTEETAGTVAWSSGLGRPGGTRLLATSAIAEQNGRYTIQAERPAGGEAADDDFGGIGRWER